jgi:nitrogen fixation/metabolism regulation signal transduction histidine kinase
MREAKPSANKPIERKQMTESSVQNELKDLNTLKNLLEGVIIDTTPKSWYKRAASAASTNIKTRAYNVKGKIHTLTFSVKYRLHNIKNSVSNNSVYMSFKAWLQKAYNRIAHFVHQHTVVRLFFYMLGMVAALAVIFSAIWVLVTWALAAAEAVFLITGSVFLANMVFFILYVGGIIGFCAIAFPVLDM